MEVVKKQKDTTFPLFLPFVSLYAQPLKGLPNFCPGTGLRFDARMRQNQGLLHAKNKGKLTRERQTKTWSRATFPSISTLVLPLHTPP
jgi:hypothetical protein